MGPQTGTHQKLVRKFHLGTSFFLYVRVRTHPFLWCATNMDRSTHIAQKIARPTASCSCIIHSIHTDFINVAGRLPLALIHKHHECVRCIPQITQQHTRSGKMKAFKGRQAVGRVQINKTTYWILCFFYIYTNVVCERKWTYAHLHLCDSGGFHSFKSLLNFGWYFSLESLWRIMIDIKPELDQWWECRLLRVAKIKRVFS